MEALRVSCEVRISSAYIKVKLSPSEAVEALRISCEVRIPSTYKDVKLSPEQAVEDRKRFL
jgi:hypothetical protein